MPNGVSPAPETTWQTALESAAIALLVIDSRGFTVWSNRLAGKLLGGEGDSVSIDFFQKSSHNLEEIQKALRTVGSSVETIGVAWELMRSDGSVVPVEGTLSTAGEGTYSMRVSHYAQVPPAEQQKVLTQYGKKHAEED